MPRSQLPFFFLPTVCSGRALTNGVLPSCLFFNEAAASVPRPSAPHLEERPLFSPFSFHLCEDTPKKFSCGKPFGLNYSPLLPLSLRIEIGLEWTGRLRAALRLFGRVQIPSLASSPAAPASLPRFPFLAASRNRNSWEYLSAKPAPQHDPPFFFCLADFYTKK